MTWQHTDRSKEDYNYAPLAVQKAFDKQARLLSSNLRHPSVRAKKIDETRDICQGRVNQAWRFFFKIVDDTYVILRIVPHPK